jgi:chemotaxis protein MotB
MRLMLPPRDHGHGGGGAERYLITYADMITLLLVLFIILYATANQDLEKFKALSQSLSEGFGATVPSKAETISDEGTEAGTSPVADTSGGGTTPLELFPENQTPVQIFQFAIELQGGGDGQLRNELEKLVAQAAQAAGAEMGGAEPSIEVSYNERGLVITIQPDQILFDSGTAILKPGFRAIIDKLAPFLAGLPNRIEVHGHTDNQQIATAQFPSNWELSAARAGSVIRYLETKGLAPDKLGAAGYADTRPAADNSTAEGRSRNRRVEIVILRQSTDAEPPSGGIKTEIQAGGAAPASAPESVGGEQSGGGH